MAVLRVRDGLRFTLPRDPVALSAALREAEETQMIAIEFPSLVKRSLPSRAYNIQRQVMQKSTVSNVTAACPIGSNRQ